MSETVSQNPVHIHGVAPPEYLYDSGGCRIPEMGADGSVVIIDSRKGPIYLPERAVEALALAHHKRLLHVAKLQAELAAQQSAPARPEWQSAVEGFAPRGSVRCNHCGQPNDPAPDHNMGRCWKCRGELPNGGFPPDDSTEPEPAPSTAHYPDGLPGNAAHLNWPGQAAPLPYLPYPAWKRDDGSICHGTSPVDYATRPMNATQRAEHYRRSGYVSEAKKAEREAQAQQIATAVVDEMERRNRSTE